ncbi:MAG TPA: nitrogen fixation protein NifQ [Azospirillaceae bacterium]|nr:nitrogen fixation protein NifQ [Azospirillaceae bacterium]
MDRLLFDRIITLAVNETRHPLTQSLGLTRDALAGLIDRYLPERRALLSTLPADADTGPDALEEADLRAFILEHRAGVHTDEEAWLAAIIARRSLGSNHLWQDMGFADRSELSRMFHRHFPALAARNSGDMKWKKFFYRQLCEREGMKLCKAPHCEVCDDFAACFDGEPGDPITTLARLSRAS